MISPVTKVMDFPSRHLLLDGWSVLCAGWLVLLIEWPVLLVGWSELVGGFLDCGLQAETAMCLLAQS